MRIEEQFNQIAEEYDSKRKLFIPCYDDFYISTTDLICGSIPSPAGILDLGAGTGLLTMYWFRKFPQSKFVKATCEFDTSKFWKFIEKKCCLIVWSCENIKLKHWESIPYISKAKCRAIQGGNYGNGKV